MSSPLWLPIAVALVWTFLIALPVGFLIGRAVRRNTEVLPEPADWLRAEDMPDWDWPAKGDEERAA